MSKLLIEERPLQVLPMLAAEIGLNEAIIIQQIHYWLDKSSNFRDEDFWVYKTYKEWQEEFPFWSDSTIRRSITSLEKRNLLISTDKYNSMPMDKTKWYRINRVELSKIEESVLVKYREKEEKRKNRYRKKAVNKPCGQNDQSIVQNEKAYGQNEQSFSQNDQLWTGQNDQSNNHRLSEITTEITTNNLKEEDRPQPQFNLFEEIRLLTGKMPSAIQTEEIMKWRDTLPTEVLQEALKRTKEATPDSPFRYMKAIISHWQAKGLRTLEAIMQDDTKRQGGNKNAINQRQQLHANDDEKRKLQEKHDRIEKMRGNRPIDEVDF